MNGNRDGIIPASGAPTLAALKTVPPTTTPFVTQELTFPSASSTVSVVGAAPISAVVNVEGLEHQQYICRSTVV
ncbi:MAG: hypothetical protein R2879_00780 [Saprospiraceae bacterium]